MEIDAVIYEVEQIFFLKTVKNLLNLLEPHSSSLFNVITEVLIYVQELVNWVWSYVLHDTNRTNLNLKLLLFMQLLEEIFMRKIFHSSRGKDALECEKFYETLARLMIIFEDTKMLYFDQPNPNIIDTNKNSSNVTGILRNHEPAPPKELSFLYGGPLRVFLSIFLQLLRKLKPQ